MEKRPAIEDFVPTESKMLHLMSALRNWQFAFIKNCQASSSTACNPIAKVGNQINYRAFQSHCLGKPRTIVEVVQCLTLAR